LDIDHALELLEGGFGAPETAPAKTAVPVVAGFPDVDFVSAGAA
jgi:hypothetical protein